VPFHKWVEGNAKPHEKGKAGALGEKQGVMAIAEKHKGISIAAIQRRVSEAKWSGIKQWWKAKLSNKAIYRMNTKKRRMANEVS
jgi:hypothetical protein